MNAPWPHTHREEEAQEFECWETDQWAIDAILNAEILTHHVYDPCCGPGRMSKAAKHKNYCVTATDINDWGYGKKRDHDFLNDPLGDAYSFRPEVSTLFINPPFSKACQFIDRAMELSFRKIVCFQRFAWWEGAYDTGSKRGAWWERNKPNRIYICGNRAPAWLAHIPPEDRKGGSTIAHAWFVWERGHPQGTVLGHVYKGDV